MFKSILSIILCISVSWTNQQPTIETALGTVMGHYKSSYEGRTYSAFEGIPYAKPPVDDLRFQEPQPAGSWDGTLNATTLYTCLQMAGADTVFGQEDCLYLNVYVPKEEPSKTDNFDVLVHIHGGAFMVGRGAMADPLYFMDRDIIYIHFNYRLGLLGFLSTEDDVVPGNNGLKDQQLALKWIQSNIKRFGGNPNSVTIIGLSAGAASVHFHYFSPLSKGLFHRGISSSGTVLMPWTIQERALEKTKKLGKLNDCQNPQIKNVIECLKKVPGKELVGKTSNFYEFSSILPIAPFAPVVEQKSKSAFLTEPPHQLLLTGEFNDVPWLTSITMAEGIYPVAAFEHQLDEINQNWDELLPILLDYKYTTDESAKANIAKEIKDYYFDNEELSSKNIDNLVKLFSDRYFNMGFETAIHLQSKASKSPIYAYIYNYEIDFGLASFTGSTLKGTSHGDDAFLMYDFNFYEIPREKRILSPADASMKDVLVGLVTAFVTDGNPQVKDINWEPMTDETFNYLYIPNIDEIAMFNSAQIMPRQFWESLDISMYKREPELRDEL